MFARATTLRAKTIVDRVMASAAATALLATSTVAHAATDDIVYVQGRVLSEKELKFAGIPSKKALWEIDTDFCRTDLMSPVELDVLAYILALGGSRLHQHEEQCAKKKNNKPSGDFSIIYASCMMLMRQGDQQMLISLPPSSRGATMELRSPGQEPISKSLTVGAAVMAGMPPVMGEMISMKVELAPGANRGRHLGYATRLYKTKYSGGGGRTFSPRLPIEIFGSRKLTPEFSIIGAESAGTVWVAPDAPGIDVVRAFYRKFAKEAEVPEIFNGFLGGLVSQMAAIADKGMPMVIDQTISSSLRGPAAFGSASRSVQEVTSVHVLPREDAHPLLRDICDASLIKPGEDVQDLDKMMGGQASGSEASEMEQAMGEASEMMKDLDPATRAILKRMGIKVPGQ